MNKDQAALCEQIVACVRHMDLCIVERLCSELEHIPTSDHTVEIGRLIRLASQAPVRDDLADLMNMWSKTTEPITPSNLAWAIRSAAVADQIHRAEQSIELVWTGPTSSDVKLRRTQQVLLDLIRNARASVMIVTFAAYKVPEVAEELVKAADRGVSIALILESPEESEGKVAFEALQALGTKVGEKSRVYVWPHEKRPHDSEGHHGPMHVKCAIVDGRALLVSSANLTEFAHNINMELGVLIRGENVPSKVMSHFDRLIGEGVFTQIVL